MRKWRRALSVLCAAVLLFSLPPVSAEAAPAADAAGDYAAQAEARKELPVASNEWENWPAGPALGSEAAILMEAETGAILYEKNIHEKLYPASITKI